MRNLIDRGEFSTVPGGYFRTKFENSRVLIFLLQVKDLELIGFENGSAQNLPPRGGLQMPGMENLA